MALFGAKGKNLVGLDVGSSAVKMVSLKPARGGYEVAGTGIETLPAGTIVEGVIAKREAVVGAITRIFDSQRIKEEQVATSVSGHSVIVKKITLPVLNAEEVRESIQWEAEQYIPFDISEVYLDYHVLGPFGEGNQTNVILVAAKRETVDNQTDVVSMAGKNPVVVDIDSFALHNVYEINYQPEPDTVVALLNIGASILNVNIAKGSEFLFTRDIGMGGNYYTEYLQRDLGVSWEEAEKYKRGGAPGELTVSVSSVMQSVSEILALEVQKTFDYFRTAAQFEEIENIYICGGASRTEGLREYLEEQFRVPVHFLNPFGTIKADGGTMPASSGEDKGTDLAVAVGLALRYAGDKSAAQGGTSGGLGGLFKKLTGR
ncbi:pilus assembly protein PilM [Acidobacteria bacterium AH-259-A15]|nr:pilus assembly protein PilM [Acidobacteria bacterium AH-259-A15]